MHDDTVSNSTFLSASLQELYPVPGRKPLEGLYLCNDLRRCLSGGGACVYSNFIASLDGRIAIASGAGGQLQVPQATTNPRDWRLFLELLAAADAILVSGRYLRELDQSAAQALPPLEGELPDDLAAYRKQAGLPEVPALVVVSNSLDFPLDRLADYRRRPVLVATGAGAGDDGVRRLDREGIDVVRAGRSRVDGKDLVDALEKQGLKLVYSIAGPGVLHTLLEAGMLRRLYLTTVLRLLSGTHYATMARGEPLEPARDFSLSALYLDDHGPDGVQQLLQVYDRRD
jgi:riboflavin biosynthesis pyrimidine reductase